MYFQHSPEVWRDFPDLVAGALYVTGVTADVSVEPRVAEFNDIAASRLEASSEGGLAEVQAWRRTFSKMGLKPTQYRSASESLLRRFRKENSLPQIHPLIDLCNAISLASAIPVAVFDTSKIADYLEVRYASGAETYLTFSGETENPDVHEVIFADAAERAHARRWTNRQSGYSAVRDSTATALVVVEALHESAQSDIRNLTTTIAGELSDAWKADPKSSILSRPETRFDF